LCSTKAQLAGFSVQNIADLEAVILDGEVASDMIKGGNRLVGIRVRYPEEYRSSIDKLKSLNRC
jgi:Cu/Ag efflux pump CusA